MAEQFLHGVEVVEIDTGTRPVKTVKSSVIGIIGTAPDADATVFPYNTPVLIAGNRLEAAKLDTVGDGDGTLPGAMDDIFDQIGAMVVVVRVEVGADDAATQSNVIGGVNATTGKYEGLHALIGAKSIVKVEPRIVIVTGFSQIQAVATEMGVIIERLHGMAIIDGPSTTDTAAIAYRDNFSSKRMYVIDPAVKVWDTATDAEVVRYSSARAAGLLAKSDNNRGFWHSPSNQGILGIIGTERAIDFKLGDPNCRANLLNENEVATIIQEDGYRLWGNRTCSSDPKWAFISVVRTADIINDSLQRAHLWAVDRNITKNYIEAVVGSVNAYLRTLVELKAILGGECWADPELNTSENLQAGKVYIDFDFTAPAPAEHITFRSRLVNDYYETIFN